MLRFAPSPTDDIYIDDLRVAIFNYIVARQKKRQFIVRIDDIDKQKNIEGKDTEILQILEKFAISHERVFHQSENFHIHQTLAVKLLEQKKAFICTCTPEQIKADRESKESQTTDYSCSGRCLSMTQDELNRVKEEKIPFVIRIKKPTTPIKYSDLIRGEIETTPDEIDSFIILQADSTPTHNFASACDDIFTDIDFIIHSEENSSDTPKQIYIKKLLGYDRDTTYAHLPTILDNNISVRWLFSEGFIPDAIINYLVQLDNRVPKEIFNLPQAVEWFEIAKISKESIKFDIDRLRYINREHLKLIDDKELSSIFGFADREIGKLAKLYLEEFSTINELDTKIKSIFSNKNFSGNWGEEMRVLEKIISDMKPIDEFDQFKHYLMNKSGFEDEKLSKPLYRLLTGMESGPELSQIYPHIKSYILEVAS